MAIAKDGSEAIAQAHRPGPSVGGVTTSALLNEEQLLVARQQSNQPSRGHFPGLHPRPDEIGDLAFEPASVNRV